MSVVRHEVCPRCAYVYLHAEGTGCPRCERDALRAALADIMRIEPIATADGAVTLPHYEVKRIVEAALASPAPEAKGCDDYARGYSAALDDAVKEVEAVSSWKQHNGCEEKPAVFVSAVIDVIRALKEKP